MVPSKSVAPRYFPWNGSRAPEQINRLTDITGDLALNRDKEYEIGREAILDYLKKTPAFTGKFKQYENGDMKFWYCLVNQAAPGTGASHAVVLDDLKITIGDIAAFLTDENDTFTGTILFPKLRVSGLSINIADPTSIVERNFSVVGEKYQILDDKYYAYETATVAGSGSVAGTVDLTTLPPVECASGEYILKVLRVRGTTVVEITEGLSSVSDTYAYSNSTHVVTVQTCIAGDVLKVYYISNSAYTTLWTDDDTDATFLVAENCEIWIKFTSTNKIYRLQTIGIDATFTRDDKREVGNEEVVQTSVKDTSVKISLNKFAEGFSLEDILASDTIYPFIDPKDFADDIQVQVKIYSDSTHTAFKIGYLMQNVSPTAIGMSQAVQDNMKNTYALEGDNITVSDVEAEIALV
jgi:hypothetical protein